MRTVGFLKHRPISGRSECRLKARGYSILSLLWCSVTFQVLEILRESPVDPLSWGGLVCFILIAPHPVMIGLALHHAMRERPVKLRKWTEDPNADLREMG
jgi:hypothetical protein